jgi:S-adenosylmethionine decarboxylase
VLKAAFETDVVEVRELLRGEEIVAKEIAA